VSLSSRGSGFEPRRENAMQTNWFDLIFNTLLDASIRITVAAALVAAVLWILRIRASEIRHRAWTAVLLAMLTMPVLPRLMPDVALPVAIPALPWILRATDGPSAPAESPVLAVGVRSSAVLGATPSAPATDVTAIAASVPQDDVRARWPWVFAGVYASLCVGLLARLVVGLPALWRLRRSCAHAGEDAVLESALVAAPVTVGILVPRIVLPIGWRAWPRDKLLAVLAHERSHIARRDPLVSVLAHVNRCLFWFHPLAWWLERRLAILAEHACDDAAIRAVGARRRYAEVLLDMAQAVQKRGARLTWVGVGVGGDGRLGARLDRILNNHAGRTVSRVRRGAAIAGSVAAIGWVVACQKPVEVAPLREDPEISARWAIDKARRDAYDAARALTPTQVAELRAAFSKQPGDLAVLEKLLIFYGPDLSGKRPPNEAETVAARRELILWLIAHQPEHELAGSLNARIFATPQNWLPDPAGYAQAKALWMKQVTAPGASAAVLSNAAYFFEVHDKPLAEQALLRAIEIDPDGKTLPRLTGSLARSRFISRLGALYAQSLVGSNVFTLGNVIQGTSESEARSAYAAEVRRKLERSTDAALLTAVARYLTVNSSQAKSGIDHVALGRQYLEQAIKSNPQATTAREMLAADAGDLRELAVRRPLLGLTPEAQYAKVAAMPETDRLSLIPWLASESYMHGEARDYYDHDQPGARAWWDLARRYAQEGLRLAARLTSQADRGAAIYHGNLTLGILALRDGDGRAAVDFMLAASHAPAWDVSKERTSGLEPRLTNYLLKYGERASVVEFLERAAPLRGQNGERMRKDAQAIRNGIMPMSYHYMMVPH